MMCYELDIDFEIANLVNFLNLKKLADERGS